MGAKPWDDGSCDSFCRLVRNFVVSDSFLPSSIGLVNGASIPETLAVICTVLTYKRRCINRHLLDTRHRHHQVRLKMIFPEGRD